jgi:nucleotide-binding universal stress UspA family protein
MSENEQGQQVVVVGVDGSKESISALRWARRYAEATGAAVRAIRAWHYPAGYGPAPVGKAPDLVSDEVKEWMKGELDADIAQVYPEPPSAGKVEARPAYGHPAEVLIDESRQASLLVVGHRGRSAFATTLLGSVSIHCVTGAFCPVVVVRGE